MGDGCGGDDPGEGGSLLGPGSSFEEGSEWDWVGGRTGCRVLSVLIFCDAFAGAGDGLGGSFLEGDIRLHEVGGIWT